MPFADCAYLSDCLPPVPASAPVSSGSVIAIARGRKEQKMYETIQSELGPKLSKGASISSKAPTRWSAYGAPKPVTTVYVDNEEDIAATVRRFWNLTISRQTAK